MQQDNYIKNKLQQLDNQQLPDLSNMDEHWKNMQASLQPVGNISTKPLFPKAGWWLIGTAVVIIAAILFTNRGAETTTLNASAENTDNIKVMPVKNDTLVSVPLISDSIVVKNTKPHTVHKKFVLAIDASKNIVRSSNFAGLNPDTNTRIDSISSRANENGKQLMLEELMNGLVKSAQEFTIDNSKDTLLVCDEGAALFIPANALHNGMVTISVKEFYKKSDIVLNKLFTTSNNNQLVSGGMLHIAANINGQPVQLSSIKPITLYFPDTGAAMKTMQLFTGEEKGKSISAVNHNADTIAFAGAINVNWLPQAQYFSNSSIATEVWVLDLRNEPYKITERKKGTVGVFNIVRKPKLSREKIKAILKEKYGYYKIRFGFGENSYNHAKRYTLAGDGSYSDIPIGDSVWMSQSKADKYKLPYIKKRSYRVTTLNGSKTSPVFTNMLNNNVAEKIAGKYAVNITSLGWINCDKFYYDSREKTNYTIHINDSAINYYTLLVFDKLKSVLNGNISGDKVMFYNLPVGEPVTIISIGIGKNGGSVIAMKKAVIDKKELDGLVFESATLPDIKTSLSKIDK